jgi:transcriptional regulator with XRE-family HTH domain
VLHFKGMAKDQNPNWDHPEAKRLRQLRRAEKYGSAQAAFGQKLGWTQPEISMYESGNRRVPRNKVLAMHKAIPGFDPLWLIEGKLDGLSFDLRTRLEEAEEEEPMKEGSHKGTGRAAS